MADTDTATALLNLAAMARMMLADDRIEAEELEVLRGLLDSTQLSDAQRGQVAAWMDNAPSDALLAELATGLDEGDRAEALSLAWVVALADGDIDPNEESALSEIAAALGVEGREELVRQAVEESFYGAALTVLSGLAIMARTHVEEGSADAKRAFFGEVFGDLGLPEGFGAEARGLLVQPRPLQTVMTEVSTLDSEFQEALLGNLWAMAWSDGRIDDKERALFGRFEAACGLPRTRVLELQVAWGPGG